MTKDSQITQEIAAPLPTFKIPHRSTGAVLHEVQAESLRAAIVSLVAKKADLSGADLAGADLSGANLAGADLSGADLSRAYLSRAYLSRAYLAGADLSRAYLSRAYLTGANLADANLAGADLSDADLSDADLSRAYLAGANGLTPGETSAVPAEPYVRDTDKNYQARAERYRRRHPEVPVIPDLDRKILAAIENGGSLEMGAWHTCETTHCRAGWAVVLAGTAGKELEGKYGPHHAGRLIYGCGTGRVPHFFATNEKALADIRKCAAESDSAGEAQAAQ